MQRHNIIYLLIVKVKNINVQLLIPRWAEALIVFEILPAYRI